MTTVEEIQKAIEQLSSDQLARFRAWFEEFDAALFDRKIEHDANTGKLDTLACTHYRASAAELRGIDRGLCEADRGEFVSTEQVEATLARHREK